MLNMLVLAVQVGGYLSIVKFVILLLGFFAVLPLVTWVFNDAKSIRSNEKRWTGILLIAITALLLLWMVLPSFWIGLVIYLVVIGTISGMYIIHRNSQVPVFDKVLTVDHIKGLIAGKDHLEKSSHGFRFITANNNDVPTPAAKTPEAFGYKLVQDLFNDAIWRRASDIAITPASGEHQVVYMIDGAPTKQPSIARDQFDYFCYFVKQLGDLDVNEKRKPQTSTFRIMKDKQRYQWEVTTAGSTVGEQIKFKRLGAEEVSRLNTLGLSEEYQEKLAELQENDNGLFLISGPKKSGISTTFYALIRNHDAFLNNINTLEHEISCELPNITQNLMSLSDSGTGSFAEKLQGMIRLGPDIIGVGDCQDGDTAQVAAVAAGSEKLVYLSMEADSVTTALVKWMKWINDRNEAISPLLAVLNQRLVRKLCDECKQAYEPNQDILRKFNLPAQKVKILYRAGKVIYDKRGKPSTCDHCQGTGYYGRMLICELLEFSNALKKAIAKAKDVSEISAALRSAKMRSLQQEGLRAVIAGQTDINEIIRILSKGKKKRKA